MELAETHETRRTVTVLFCDLVGSTSLGEGLDPEALRRVLTRYYEAMRAVVERHGGLVEKFIGDAVMAVFGLPVVHADDALRAIRAAVEMRERLAGLSAELESAYGVAISARTGINTGEVFAGDPAGGHALVTGDVVNVAARLEQAAEAREILIGDATRRLVENAVDLEDVEGLEVKGKSAKVAAWRVLGVREGESPVARRLDAPLVGRAGELAQLRDAFARAVHERTSYLFTILGVPGIGKTRLVRELSRSVGGEVLVLTGRCLSYGEGITYHPLREAVRDAAGSESKGAVLALLAGEPESERVAGALASVLGSENGDVLAEEVAWATRRLLEALARRRPLLLVLEDVHWAEPTFLDLVEYVADLVDDAPMLLLCSARPDLLEIRPGWAGGKANATTIRLEALPPEDAEALLDALALEAGIPERARERIAGAAEGNPLFLEQLVAMLAEEPSATDELPVPPTIDALLAERLERLGSEERALLERAAVLGREFRSEALAGLLPHTAVAGVPRALEGLVRRQFLRTQPTVEGESFRFRHALIQSAAYRSLPKELRADLHERVAAALDAASEGEVDELVGYHLEQAFRARSSIGLVAAETLALGRRAGERLAAAGLRAYARGDMPAAANLLGRAAGLLPADDPDRIRLLPDLALALLQTGDAEPVEGILGEALERARAAGLESVEWQAVVVGGHWSVYALPSDFDSAEAEQTGLRALEAFERLGDESGQARAWVLLSDVYAIQGRGADGARASGEAVRLFRRLGSRNEEAWNLAAAAWNMLMGPASVAEILAWCERSLEEASNQPGSTVVIVSNLAWTEAMLERFDDARRHLREDSVTVRELGLRLQEGLHMMLAGYVETLASDPVAAESWFGAAVEILEDLGERWFSSLATVDRARAVYEQGRHDDARSLAEAVIRAAEIDPEWRIKQLGLEAKLAARAGSGETALRLVDDALAVAATTDFVVFHADALLDRAEVCRLTGVSDGGRVRGAGSAATARGEGKPRRCCQGASTPGRAGLTQSSAVSMMSAASAASTSSTVL